MSVDFAHVAKQSGFGNIEKYFEWSRQVSRVLANPSLTGFINFRMGSQSINASGYKKVADAILQQKIVVFIQSGNFDTYNAIEDTLGLRSKDTNTIERQSFIIHEATHAVQDIHKFKIANAEFEAAGYLAQAIFLTRKRVKLTDLSTTSDELSAAMVVVDEWGKNWPTKVPQEDIDFIIDGIAKGGAYTNLNKQVPLDGLR